MIKLKLIDDEAMSGRAFLLAAARDISCMGVRQWSTYYNDWVEPYMIAAEGRGEACSDMEDEYLRTKSIDFPDRGLFSHYCDITEVEIADD